MNGTEKEKFRILTCYYRPKPGGFCKRLFRAINALLERGHEVHYLAVVRFPIEHPNCHFHRFPWPESRTSGYLFWGFFHCFAPIQLLYLGLRYRIDRLFAFGHNYSLLLQPLRILKRIPLTLFLRADTIENHRIKGRPAWLIKVEHIFEGLGIAGTRMYGVSQVLTDRTMARHRLLRPQKSGVLRNDIEKIPDTDKCTQKDWPLPLRLACVGVLEPRKNQRFLLEVMKDIPADKARLYLYGTGPDEDKLKKIVKEEHLADRVYFMGWMDSEKIWPQVDLLLMPSLHEGAPNAVLEAMGHGVPVLASDIPEHREILTETQVLSLADKGSWQKRIVFITESDVLQLQRMSVCQKSNLNSLLFDWDFFVERNVTEL